MIQFSSVWIFMSFKLWSCAKKVNFLGTHARQSVARGSPCSSWTRQSWVPARHCWPPTPAGSRLAPEPWRWCLLAASLVAGPYTEGKSLWCSRSETQTDNEVRVSGQRKKKNTEENAVEYVPLWCSFHKVSQSDKAVAQQKMEHTAVVGTSGYLVVHFHSANVFFI